MPTKKRKTVAKKKAAPKKVALKAVPFEKEEYSLKVVTLILYFWDALIVLYAALNIATLMTSTTVSDTATVLLNLFVTVVMLFMALLVFKIARALAANSDDGFMGTLVILLNVAIFGFSILGFPASFNPLAWGLLAVGGLGLIFLLPMAGKFTRVQSHILTTWALVLHILLWFAVVYVLPMVSASYLQ